MSRFSSGVASPVSLEVESIHKIRPLGDLVVVQRDASKTQTASGIQLPNATKSNLATVIAVGPGQPLQTGWSHGAAGQARRPRDDRPERRARSARR